MSALDPTVAAILDRPGGTIDSDDEDALIAALEEDDDPTFSALREQRLQQLHSEMSRAKQMRESGNGTYTEVKDEKAVMDITTNTKYAVVHFFKTDFGRCGVMDQHLDVYSSCLYTGIYDSGLSPFIGTRTETLRYSLPED
jgi:hypothetical protein